MRLRSLLVFAALAAHSAALAGVSLPLPHLRDQADTSHCWAYAMSNLLETRAIDREGSDLLINVEKDVKYWVDFERLLYVYTTKGDFFLSRSNEGGWQVEFWESLLKHGKQIAQSALSKPQVFYSPFMDFQNALPFSPEPRLQPDPKLPEPNEIAQQLRTSTLKPDQAREFILDYLNRWYGAPAASTSWRGSEVATPDTAPLILGSDFENNHEVESLVLVKPISDEAEGWVKYLNDRYWGYRYKQANFLKLVETSLDRRWPVTFDNVYHAMTIVGYETKKEDGATYYAVADSIPGKITWYDAARLLKDVNLATFFKEAIPGAFPPRTGLHMAFRRPRAFALTPHEIDVMDRVDQPPR